MTSDFALDVIIANVYHDSTSLDTPKFLSTPVSSCDVPAGTFSIDKAGRRLQVW